MIQTTRGGMLIMTLVFVSMFGVIFMSLTGLVNRTYHQGILQAQDETAFQIAEAGLNYARWRLAHEPENYTAYSGQVIDPQGGVVGTYDLTFTAPLVGSTIVDITAVGQTSAQPSREVTLRARYGRPSLARYAYVVNSDVYFASTMSGPFHANGGIRMDGQSDSTVSSSKETYTCQSYHGCSPPTVHDGIWGTGEDQNLWQYPVAPIDYAAMTVDLVNMSTAAQASGTYYGPSGAFGYEIVFNADGTYSIYLVTQKTNTVASCDYTSTDPVSYSCGCFSHDIANRTFLETKTVPDGIIYVEDHVWVQGEITNRVTVAAGVFPDQPSTNADIIINGSITYNGVFDGTRAFGAVAQRHVLLPWSGAPSTVRLDGAYLAQKGKFGRRNYNPSQPPQCADGINNDGDGLIDYPADSGCSSRGDTTEGSGGTSMSCQLSNTTHRLKTSIDTYGMVASYLVPGTGWTSGGVVTSGYQQKTQTYDPNFLYGPPPYFPTSGEYEFISWEEDQ